jgi:hypothetical protein
MHSLCLKRQSSALIHLLLLLLLLLVIICCLGLGLGLGLTLVNFMLDNLVVEALLDLLLLPLPGFDGADKTATLRNIAVPCHVDERGACYSGNVLLFAC